MRNSVCLAYKTFVKIINIKHQLKFWAYVFLVDIYIFQFGEKHYKLSANHLSNDK